MIGNPDEKTYFPHKLLTNTQVANLGKNFAFKSLAGIKISRTQLSKIILPGGFLDRIPGPLLKTRLALMKKWIQLLGKDLLIPLGLFTAASATEARIHKKTLSSGHRPSDLALRYTTTSIILYDEKEDIMKIVQSRIIINW